MRIYDKGALQITDEKVAGSNAMFGNYWVATWKNLMLGPNPILYPMMNSNWIKNLNLVFGQNLLLASGMP